MCWQKAGNWTTALLQASSEVWIGVRKGTIRRAVEDMGGGRQDIVDFWVWCRGWGRVVEFQQGLQMRKVNGHLGGNKSPSNTVLGVG